MTLTRAVLLAAIAIALPVLAFLVFSSHYAHHREQTMSAIVSLAFWQHMVSPGELSQGHASLENDCANCHTQVKGVEAGKCIVCHADNRALLARQPTAFHAEIGACAACHVEHQGRVPSTTRMDHVSLARIGLQQLKREPLQAGVDVATIERQMEVTTASPQPALAHLQPEEELLNCATCHQTKDRHRGLFGNDCAECHTTSKWTIAEYRHPSPASKSCAQCHQAPPSHYMMHFQMISMTVAKQEKATVAECFLCHQTTSWNDITGVGFYKHH